MTTIFHMIKHRWIFINLNPVSNLFSSQPSSVNLHFARKTFNNDHFEVHPKVLRELVRLGCISEGVINVVSQVSFPRIPISSLQLDQGSLSVGKQGDQGLNAVG